MKPLVGYLQDLYPDPVAMLPAVVEVIIVVLVVVAFMRTGFWAPHGLFV
jgi:hypothetical protein